MSLVVGEWRAAGASKGARRDAPGGLGRCVKQLLLLLVLTVSLASDLWDQQKQPGEFKGAEEAREARSPNLLTSRLTRSLLQVVAVVAAADSYSDASAESPSVEAALEDEDDDDEELDGAATNEYPDGDNDNDESYEDADDDRQESRVRESWIRVPIQGMSNGQAEAGSVAVPAPLVRIRGIEHGRSSPHHFRINRTATLHFRN